MRARNRDDPKPKKLILKPVERLNTVLKKEMIKENLRLLRIIKYTNIHQVQMQKKKLPWNLS